MYALFLAWALAAQPSPSAPPPFWIGTGGRVYTTPTLHVGVRPAVFVDRDETAVGVTLQVSTSLF